MPDEETIQDGEGNDSNSGSSASVAGLDIASQSGQRAIADAIVNSLRNFVVLADSTRLQTAETNAEASATLARSYAVGDTNSRSGESTDNASYYYTQANDKATEARSYAVGGTNSRTGEDTDNAKYYAQQASGAAQNAGTLRSDLEAAQSDISTLQSSMTSIQGNISDIQDDVTDLQSDVTTAQSDISTLQTNVTALQGSTSLPTSDGTYLLSISQGSHSWVLVTDGDGGSY